VKKVAFIDLTENRQPQPAGRSAAPNEETFVLPHLGPEGLTRGGRQAHRGGETATTSPTPAAAPWATPDDNELTLLNIQALIDAK